VVIGEDLLQNVWDQSFGGSNVAGAVLKSLRKKLGPLGSETIIGHGYRFNGFGAGGPGG
jgi:DNA-binding response OmpR family regulator